MSEESKFHLVRIAKKAIEDLIQTGKINEVDIVDPELEVDAGAFVTLKIAGALRGCIGTIKPPGKPLWVTVRDMAIAAAFNDPRFDPLTREELEIIDIEISILSPAEKIRDWQQIELGRHGVIVEKGAQGGVFLPQVAIETGWSLEEFMSELCSQKAGLERDAYKNDPELEISVFTVEVIK